MWTSKYKWVTENKVFKPEDLKYENCQIQNIEEWRRVFLKKQRTKTQSWNYQKEQDRCEKQSKKKFLKIQNTTIEKNFFK